jgi:phosphoribosylformimino-5-aminoimidazole carboxamide ribotide isomerase
MTVMIPAIDVRGGQVVRLQQGDYARQTTYSANPLELAQHYAKSGANWLHLVDLDAARDGGFSLGQLVRDIKNSTALRIQAGGGVRSRDHIQSLRDAGVDRVVVGTLALTEKVMVKTWLNDFGADAITLAFDVKRDAQGLWRCASHGWTSISTDSLDSIIADYQQQGLRHVLCTDIARDGLLGGYNLDLYRHLHEQWPSLQIQASGGVSSLQDIRSAKSLDIAGAILGRALLEGKFSLQEALAC